MPAPKQHDTDAFIDSAMRVFWSRGYEGTSINDLVQATGVNRGSIYATFDGKRDIFLSALASYDDRYRARFLAGLTAGRGPKEAILAAFRAAAEHTATADSPAGCLVVNSAVELAPHDPEIAAAVNASLSALRAFFRNRIEAAIAAGDMPGVDIEATTTTLYALFLGLRVMSRSNAPTDQKDLIVLQASRLLD
ncbi:MAG: TetR/AcrR family transcriptional regulator [Pseudorhodobacter sp.]|nr:TetR/AcrR family transcriptional regulator [Pseudorhodobacter sp.]